MLPTGAGARRWVFESNWCRVFGSESGVVLALPPSPVPPSSSGGMVKNGKVCRLENVFKERSPLKRLPLARATRYFTAQFLLNRAAASGLLACER